VSGLLALHRRPIPDGPFAPIIGYSPYGQEAEVGPESGPRAGKQRLPTSRSIFALWIDKSAMAPPFMP
jgi:hypothetical protein